MKVAVYARISTPDQEHGLAAQVDACQRFIDARAWSGIVDVLPPYQDRASGRKGEQERPGLKKLVQDGAMRRFAVLVVFRLDRLSRKEMMVAGDVVDVIKRLQGYGVRVFSATETWWDAESPAAPLILAALSWAASMESRAIADRVRAGIASAKADAVAKGERFLWGRARVSKLVADPGLPAKAAALRASGASWSKTAKALGVGRTTARRLCQIALAENGSAPEDPHME